MTRGRHAADDGSFSRSMGGAAGRGAFLLVVAVTLGIVLLQAFDRGSDPFASSLRTASTTPVTTRTPPRGAVSATTTTTPAHAPVNVKVLTANGSGVQGAAGRVGDVLRQAGDNVLSPTNTPKNVSASAVYFAPGFEADARLVAQKLSLPESSVQPLPTGPALTDLVADTKGAEVLVTVGPDLANRPSTTTTARRTTASTTTTVHRTTTPSSTTTTVRH